MGYFAVLQAENSSSAFDNLLDLFGKAQTLWGLLVALVCAFLFLICLFLFRKKVNEISENQIDHFIKERKYTPEIYIELNENMEFLRYFIFSYRWKWRIIRKYKPQIEVISKRYSKNKFMLPPQK